MNTGYCFMWNGTTGQRETFKVDTCVLTLTMPLLNINSLRVREILLFPTNAASRT